MAEKKQTQGAAKAPESKQTQAAAEAQSVAEAKAADRPTFTYQGKKYAFTASAPERLNVYGTPEPIAKIIKNEDTMEYLIEGRSAFVEQVIVKND